MITIDLNSAEPLFHQLVAQIKGAIESEQLCPGDPLPSIRQLASELELNAKTVAKAYRLLERDQVLVSNGAKGSFVHTEAKKHLSFDINEWLQHALMDDLKKYRAVGATDSEIRNAFNLAIAAKRN